MLQKGEIYSVTITDSTILGSGVAKIAGFAVFVEGAVSGDECEVEIVDIKKNFAFAKCIKVTKPSEKRIQNDCPLFPACGGCALRNVSYGFEGEIKKRAVTSAFKKVGIDVAVKDTVMPEETSYRNKVTFHFDRVGNVGFFESGSNKLLPLDGTVCAIAPVEFCRIAAEASLYIKEADISSPTEMMLRKNDGGEILLALTGKMPRYELSKLAEHITAFDSRIIGVVSRENEKDKYASVLGESHITTRLCGVNFRISPESFFQVNYQGAEALFSVVLEAAGREDFQKCADLYCGTGTIGMILASRFNDAKFWGVEINESAVEDAKYNAKLNGFDNISFYCGDAGKFSADIELDLVLVDPPRAGLSESMTDILGNIGSERIIYVSCNPFTLARDAKRLEGFGYEVSEVTPVNMFPRSEHVETVAILEKR